MQPDLKSFRIYTPLGHSTDGNIHLKGETPNKTNTTDLLEMLCLKCIYHTQFATVLLYSELLTERNVLVPLVKIFVRPHKAITVEPACNMDTLGPSLDYLGILIFQVSLCTKGILWDLKQVCGLCRCSYFQVSTGCNVHLATH